MDVPAHPNSARPSIFINSILPKMTASAEKLEAEVTSLQRSIEEVDDRLKQELKDLRPMIDARDEKTEAKNSELEELVKALQERVKKLESLTVEGGAASNKGKWALSCPKDMQPTCGGGKEEGWKKWREEVLDYCDAVHPGLRSALEWSVKSRTEITEEKLEGNPLASLTEKKWKMRTEVYTLIKRKTEAPSEARKIVETVPQENGYEAFRMLGLGYEPQTGLKRLIEMSEINLLQNKRCKTAAETALVLLEIERRKMRILKIGGDAPPSDTLVTVLWVAMDPNTKAYVAGKIDLDSMEYVESVRRS